MNRYTDTVGKQSCNYRSMDSKPLPHNFTKKCAQLSRH